MSAQASTFPEVQEQTIEGNSAITHMALKADDTKLSFICPSVINFTMKANGEFITPTAGQAYIENLSLMPLRMKSYTITSDTAAKGMISTTGATDDNAYEVKVKTQLGNATPFAVTQSALTASEWSMTKTGGDTPKLDLTFSDGKMVNITNHWGSGAHLQDVVWNATADINSQVTVQFDSTGGSPIPDQTLVTGGKATAPTTPTRDGYEFDGWFTDSAYTQSFDFEGTAVNQYTLLFAKWKKLTREAYAVLTDAHESGGGTLTYYYDLNKTSRTGDAIYDVYMDCRRNDRIFGEPDKYQPYEGEIDPDNVIIDVTFKSAPIISCCSLFYNFHNITGVDTLSNININNVKDVSYMFYGCENLNNININQFVYAMSTMGTFENCISLSNISINLLTKVIIANDMFKNCTSLKEIDLSNWNPTEMVPTDDFVVELRGMFEGCTNLVTANIKQLSAHWVGSGGMSWPNLETSIMFAGCENLETVYCDNSWPDFSGNMMFIGCSKLPHQDSGQIIEPFATFIANGGNFTHTGLQPYTVLLPDSSEGTYVLEFRWDSNRSNYEQQGYATYNINNLVDEPLCASEWSDRIGDTGDIKEVNFDSSFKNIKALNCAQWFNNNWAGSSILKIDHIENFDTSKIKDMSNMFMGCSSLAELNVSNFNTSQATDMTSMFQNCSGLTTLDVTNFDTSNVKYMGADGGSMSERGMFYGCSNLKSLDISNFDISEVEGTSAMFAYCSNLEHIYCNNNWSQSPKLTDSGYMFSDCSKLPHFDSSKVDKTYAYPDNNTTGYFTPTS